MTTDGRIRTEPRHIRHEPISIGSRPAISRIITVSPALSSAKSVSIFATQHAAAVMEAHCVPTLKVQEVLKMLADDGWILVRPGAHRQFRHPEKPRTYDTTTPLGAPDAYPFAVVPTATGFSAGALQFAAVATAPTREALLVRLADLVALHVAEAQVADEPAQPPRAPDTLDLRDYAAEGLKPEITYVRPAPISETSVAIGRALREEHLSGAELARRMGVPRSVVSRLTDPLYFGHSTRTLRSVADALGRHLRVAFEPTDARRA